MRRSSARYPGDPTRYSGRRIDLLGALASGPTQHRPDRCHPALPAARRTASAKALAAKAVVLIDPQHRVGEIVWPDGSQPGW